MATNLTPQTALTDLCACLKGRVPAAIDWEGVLGLANRTLVTPALAEALATQKARIPDEAAGMLQVIAERTAARNRLMHDQLVEAVAALGSRGIRPILLKGAALLARRGPHCANRLLTDLDLMVPREQSDEAVQVLASIGYRPLGEAPASIGSKQGVDLGRESDVGGIDLHYRLKRSGGECDAEWLEAQCSPFALNDAVAAMPSRDALAALFVLHDQLQEGDYWRGRIDLRHLVDLAALAGEQGGLDGAALAAFFPPGRARRALAVQLDTLERWLDVRVPIDAGGAGGRTRVALQRWRRTLQLRRPGTETAFTLASWVIDPPLGLFEHRGVAARGREVRRMLLEKKATKV